MLVINCTVVQNDAVAVRVIIVSLKGHCEAYKVISLICITCQLLYNVCVIRISTEPVINFRYMVCTANDSIGISIL